MFTCLFTKYEKECKKEITVIQTDVFKTTDILLVDANHFTGHLNEWSKAQQQITYNNICKVSNFEAKLMASTVKLIVNLKYS
jgi:hypothetical protein